MHFDRSKISEAEADLIEWQYQLGLGHFKAALWAAMAHADTGNLARLATGFPEEVAAYSNFIATPGYWENVKERAGIADKEGW